MRFVVLALAVLAAVLFSGKLAAQDVSVPSNPVTPLDQCPYWPGWNLVTLEGSVDDLPECVTYAFYYDGLNERWYIWGRSGPDWACDLKTFELGKGYWLYVPR